MTIKYFSQWAESGVGREACGEAAVQMALSASGIFPSCLELVNIADPARDGTLASDLIRLFWHYGISAQVVTGASLPDVPAILLFNYGALSRSDVWDTNYRGDHWFILLGIEGEYAIVDDPDYAGSRITEGDHKRYKLSEIKAGYAGQAIKWVDKVTTTVTAKVGTVTSDMPFLRLRARPGGISEGGTIIGAIKNGTVIPITGQASAQNGQLWYSTIFKAQYANVYADEAMTTPYEAVALTGWVFFGLVTIAADKPPPVVTLPPVTAQTRTRMGVNIIGGNAQVIQSWLDAGCKRIHIAFNPDAAVKLHRNHPEVEVSHRALFYGGHLPSVQEFRDKHGYCLTEKGMKVFGVNENDQIGDGGQSGEAPDQIRQRAEWDAQMWQLCKDNGSTFVGGGYAMGTPNIVVASIRKAMRDYYAPLFNAGMLFNQHLYSGNDHSGIPIKTSIYSNVTNLVTWDGISVPVRQTWWLPERPRFYVAFCGFDGSKSAFECDETGVDNPGPFNDFGFTEVEKAAWAAEWCRRNSEPMPDGSQYHVNSGCLFADGDYNKWAAFANSIKPPSIWKASF
jgi:hypothetical protein